MPNKKLKELLDKINGLNKMTGRQLIILCASVKNLYDDREKYGKDVQAMKNACASMLLSEIYEPKGAVVNE